MIAVEAVGINVAEEDAKVALARGNHETRNMTSRYGFKQEVISKYGEAMYDLF